MAAIVDYSTLAAAIATWEERTVDADELIGLSEAEFRIYLGPNFSKETSTTLTVASGSAALPTGLVRILAVTHDTYGTLSETTIASVRSRRINGSGVPSEYAVTGSTIEFGPSFDDDVTLDFEDTLTGLSGSNATNWLITYAPQAYLSMCQGFSKAKQEDYQNAALLKAASLKTLDDLGIQSMLTQYSRATVRIPGMTP